VAELGERLENFFAIVERIFFLPGTFAALAARRLDRFWLRLRRALFQTSCRIVISGSP